MDVLSHSRVGRLRRQGMSWRVAAGQAGASFADVRRTLREADDEPDDDDPDDRGQALAELREEIRSAGGFAAWWRT
jgi:hypothetical protein